MKELHKILHSPMITEKGTSLKEDNQVLFKVDCSANKLEIKYAIEKAFKVKVLDVRTMRVKGKTKRYGRYIGKKSDWKKAIVTLAQGNNIEFFEGV